MVLLASRRCRAWVGTAEIAVRVGDRFLEQLRIHQPLGCAAQHVDTRRNALIFRQGVTIAGTREITARKGAVIVQGRFVRCCGHQRVDVGRRRPLFLAAVTPTGIGPSDVIEPAAIKAGDDFATEPTLAASIATCNRVRIWAARL